MGFQNAAALKYDPYRKFKFLVKWDGKIVAAVQKVSAITKHIDPVEWRTGGDPNFSAKLPGMTKYDPITLERGLSAAPEFVDWMNKVSKYQLAGGTTEEHVHAFRKDVTIEMYNLASDKVLTIAVYQAWPSKLTLVDFDAKSNEISMEMLELQHEGWDIIERVASADERK
jgi:phage tail-like protein